MGHLEPSQHVPGLRRAKRGIPKSPNSDKDPTNRVADSADQVFFLFFSRWSKSSGWLDKGDGTDGWIPGLIFVGPLKPEPGQGLGITA